MELYTTDYVAAILIWAILAVMTAAIAGCKDRSRIVWFVIGLLLPGLAVLIALTLSPIPDSRR